MGSRARPAPSVAGCQASEKPSRWPLDTVNSATVVKSRPCTGTGLEKTQAVPAGHHGQAVTGALHPRHDRAVVEADDQFQLHVDGAFPALDDAEDGGVHGVGRHEVDDGHRAPGGAVDRLQHQGVGVIGAGHLLGGLDGRDQPAAVAGLTQQRGEAGGGVDAGRAPPVDGSAAVDEGHRAGVADDPVVLDQRGHGPILARRRRARPVLCRPGRSGGGSAPGIERPRPTSPGEPPLNRSWVGRFGCHHDGMRADRLVAILLLLQTARPGDLGRGGGRAGGVRAHRPS